LLNLVAVDRIEQGLARRKMTVKGADADTGRLCDGFEARFGSTSAEHGSRSLKDSVAVPECVGARLSRSFFLQLILVQRLFFPNLFYMGRALVKRRNPPYISYGNANT